MPYTAHRYDSIPPSNDSEVRCDVCGFGIEEERTTETDRVVVSYVTTGTVWHDADPRNVDKTVVDVIPPWTNCPLCGSNMWRRGGRRGSL